MSFVKPKAFEANLQDRILGLVVLAAFALVIYAIYISQSLQIGQQTSFKVKALLNQTYGIETNSSVTLSGVLIGHVASVALTEHAKVEISLDLDPKYSSFYRQGSRLGIDSQLGLNTVISGSGILFLPPEFGSPPLISGSYIEVEQPQSFADLLDEWQAEKIAAEIVSMVEDLTEVSSTINDNQAKMVAILNNIELFSLQLQASSSQLPQLLNQTAMTLAEVQKMTQSFTDIGNKLAPDLSRTLATSEQTLFQFQQSTNDLTPTIKALPQVVQNLNMTLLSSQKLINTLNKHWLIGSNEGKNKSLQLQMHPFDGKLYEIPQQILQDEQR